MDVFVTSNYNLLSWQFTKRNITAFIDKLTKKLFNLNRKENSPNLGDLTFGDLDSDWDLI